MQSGDGYAEDLVVKGEESLGSLFKGDTIWLMCDVYAGEHMASVEEYLAKGRFCGCQFLPTYNNKQKLTVGVSPAIAKEFPTVPMLLLQIAQAAGSRIEFARSPRVVEKKFKKAARSNATARTRLILATQSECNEVKTKYKLAYANGNDFLRLFQTVAPDAVVCPGFG